VAIFVFHVSFPLIVLAAGGIGFFRARRWPQTAAPADDTDTHIAAMAQALATRPARPAPDLATVEQTLGPIAAEAAAPRPRTRRRDAG
jgi:hypothetical protein